MRPSQGLGLAAPMPAAMRLQPPSVAPTEATLPSYWEQGEHPRLENVLPTEEASNFLPAILVVRISALETIPGPHITGLDFHKPWSLSNRRSRAVRRRVGCTRHRGVSLGGSLRKTAFHLGLHVGQTELLPAPANESLRLISLNLLHVKRLAALRDGRGILRFLVNRNTSVNA